MVYCIQVLDHKLTCTFNQLVNSILDGSISIRGVLRVRNESEKKWFKIAM